MSRSVIGIDPGKQGFITILNASGGVVGQHPIPLIGKEFDFKGFADLVLDFSAKFSLNPEEAIVIIEDVHALPRSAASATFTFGGVCYAIRMAFIMLGYPVILVTPKKWQKEMYEGIHANEDKKVMSIEAAQRLFPNVNLRRTERSKKPDDNLTDSLLIAEYGRRHYR